MRRFGIRCQSARARVRACIARLRRDAPTGRVEDAIADHGDDVSNEIHFLVWLGSSYFPAAFAAACGPIRIGPIGMARGGARPRTAHFRDRVSASNKNRAAKAACAKSKQQCKTMRRRLFGGAAAMRRDERRTFGVESEARKQRIGVRTDEELESIAICRAERRHLHDSCGFRTAC